jgi:asparagine synthase (glutamine-hydrolysing)
MCGIAAVVAPGAPAEECREAVSSMLATIVHRGDEEHALGVIAGAGFGLGSNRLAIVDRAHAHQPMMVDGELFVVFNGEIYNHADLRERLVRAGCRFRTESDTEVLLHGFRTWGVDLASELDGMFAFVLHDTRSRHTFAARDPLGVKPLYVGRGRDGSIALASELKALVGRVESIAPVPPGHRFVDGSSEPYFQLDRTALPEDDEMLVRRFRTLFERAVEKRLRTDLPVAVIFSGGIDSAAVLRLATEYHDDVTAFTVGFPGASDVELARRFCAEYGIPQCIQLLETDDLIAALPSLVQHVETFETVDIMDASVMAPAFRLVREAGIKVALCGDGSDELLAGYDLFKTHPEPDRLVHYRLSNLHRTDLQRVDRTSMLYTVEARVPFMDRELVEFAYSVPMSLKLRDGVEKWILRKAVSDVLPPWIAWRKKVRMPEGTGLMYKLLDYARRQPVRVDRHLLERLGIDQPDGAFFLDQYLRSGYPEPAERYKRPSLDFAENGYFVFGAAA